MNYRTQKQAQQTAVNTINSFNLQLKKIYESTPKGTIDQVIWCTYLLGLQTKCKETVANIKQSMNR